MDTAASHTSRHALALGILVAWADVALPYCRGRLQLGHWPIPNSDDPKDLDMSAHLASARFALLIIFAATVLALIVLGMDAAKKREGGRLSRLLAVAAGMSIALWMLTPLVGWIRD